MVALLGALRREETVTEPALTDIVQLDLYEDVVLNVFPSLEMASYYVLATSGKNKSLSVIKRNLLVGMRRKDGRYGKSRWVSGEQYKNKDYSPYVRESFPQGEKLVQLFIGSDSVVNVFASLEIASYVTGIPENRLKMALCTRSGYSGGYRFVTFTDYVERKIPATLTPKQIRTQGVRDYPKDTENGVIIMDNDLTVRGRMPLAMAKDVYNIDGMAELVLDECGSLPRGTDTLTLEPRFWEEVRKKEQENPLNSRYIVEVDVRGQAIKEYFSYRALATELEVSLQDVKNSIGSQYQGRRFESKITYCQQ